MPRALAVMLFLAIGCNDNSRPTPDTTRTPDMRPSETRPPDTWRDICLSSTNLAKILFLVDLSASMQFTDPKVKRQDAVKVVIDALKNNPYVTFAILGYNARITVNASSSGYFTSNPAVLTAALGHLGQADVLSDLQSALTTAAQLLATDMQKATVTTTRYVVILLSDGGTGPVCAAGCSNDWKSLAGECTGGKCGTPSVPGHDGGPRDAGVDASSWCDIPRAQWCDVYEPKDCSDMNKWFPAMTAPCLEYNSEQLLVGQVKALVALKDQQKAQALRLHAVRLIDTTVSSDVLKLMGIDAAKAETFLRKLATEGGGTYLDLYGSSTNLLELPLQPLCP